VQRVRLRLDFISFPICQVGVIIPHRPTSRQLRLNTARIVSGLHAAAENMVIQTRLSDRGKRNKNCPERDCRRSGVQIFGKRGEKGVFAAAAQRQLWAFPGIIRADRAKSRNY
jgi:hypothetical protein